jgi:hypothetical protein
VAPCADARSATSSDGDARGRFNVLARGDQADRDLLPYILWWLIKPTLLAIDDQPLLCDCGPSGPCASCEPA